MSLQPPSLTRTAPRFPYTTLGRCTTVPSGEAMSDARKVPASAGAEWLLGGFGLLRKAPLGLGLLGALYGVLALVMGMSAQRSVGLFMVLEDRKSTRLNSSH